MKKTISLILVLLLTASLFAGCGEDAAPETTVPESGPKLWFAYNTENLMQTEVYADKMAERDSTLRLYGVRGETESVQLMITPDAHVDSFELKANDLVNENGDKLKKGNIEFYCQWYVYLDTTYNPDAYLGYYPDALVPYKAYKRARYNTIRAGENQGIWIEVKIPKDAAAGTYTGTVELELDKKDYEIPVELKVYDAQMPEEVHPKSCFLIWYDLIAKGEGKYTPELGTAYYDFLVERRIMPMDPIPAIWNNYDAYVDWVVENAAENPKVPCYCLPKKWADSEIGSVVSETALMDILTRLAKRNVELREAGNETIDLFKKAYVYIMDEPAGEALERTKLCDLIVSRCKFAVADEYLKDYPDLYNSLAGLSNIVTIGYNPDLVGSDTEGGVQTWCPLFDNWHTEEQRQTYYDRMNTTDRLMGEDAWWYGCVGPRPPYPTYHLDDDLFSPRILSWMQYDYRCDGNLYWCVNTYTDDMWETPVICFGDVSGEGNLLYPGAKFSIDGPISTLRLESIREGMEDFEYFWMIEQAILAYNAENGTDYDAQALMKPLYADLYSGMMLTRYEPELFCSRRVRVLETLELILADTLAGIEKLQAM